MRRKDREITDPKRINEIIAACDCCRVGLADGESVYVVPLNFGYSGDVGVFYFHCAKEGKKLALIAANPNAGFELDTNHEVIRGEKGCSFSFRYSSVMGKGKITEVAEPAEKKAALALIVAHYGGPGDGRFTGAEAASVTVLRLDVTEMTAKEHR